MSARVVRRHDLQAPKPGSRQKTNRVLAWNDQLQKERARLIAIHGKLLSERTEGSTIIYLFASGTRVVTNLPSWATTDAPPSYYRR